MVSSIVDEKTRHGNLAPEDASAEPPAEIAMRCLHRLSEPERQVLLDHHFGGRTDQEVGTRLFGEAGTPRARGRRVWNLRHAAYKRLRVFLQAEGVDLGDVG
jgi:DNA-directed RNA polymerase specialized sigma24 family protein